MTGPVRLQLSRGRGFRLQGHSRAINGLPAVLVARPSKWGNPYKIAPAFVCNDATVPAVDSETAVRLFREAWDRRIGSVTCRAELDELRGKNLACWCALDAPCHADVLLEIANR